VTEDLAEPLNQDIAEAEAESRLLGRLDHALRGLRPASADEPALASPTPKSVPLALALGIAHLNAGMLEAAERELRDALASDRASGEAHENLALALARLGRLDAAEEQLQAADAAGASVSPRVREEVARLKAALEL
jgi:Flp pilus assembly protein TadD